MSPLIIIELAQTIQADRLRDAERTRRRPRKRATAATSR